MFHIEIHSVLFLLMDTNDSQAMAVGLGAGLGGFIGAVRIVESLKRQKQPELSFRLLSDVFYGIVSVDRKFD